MNWRKYHNLKRNISEVKIEEGLGISPNPLQSLEAATGFEPVNNGFAV